MDSEEKCFTFIWKLENISYCKETKDEAIYGPVFVAKCINKTKWKLALYPREGDNIALYLFRETDSEHFVPEEIKYELAFTADDGSDLTSWDACIYDFYDLPGHGIPDIAKREDVFISKRSEFLPQETLTARCRMWSTVREMTENVHCSACTRIGVHKISFGWDVINFSTLESEQKRTCEITSIEDDSPLISVDLCLKGGLNYEEIICFEMLFQDQNVKYFTLRLFLIEASGSKVDCNQEEFWINDASKSEQFKFLFTKRKLMAVESYLPDDILQLHWECAFSKGIISNEIEDVRYGYMRSKGKLSNPLNVESGKMTSPCTLNENLKCLYDQNFLCDVKLKTNTRMFNAHKVILSGCSSVFKAMFSTDMKEKESNYINIEDLNDDTINEMLSFIYTDRVEGLDLKRASHLYMAADKYAIFSLKNTCSSYMKKHLSLSNVCEVLLLCDLHADTELKNAVQDYILKHIKGVVNSDEWKLLVETNGKLAAETVCLQYK